MEEQEERRPTTVIAVGKSILNFGFPSLNRRTIDENDVNGVAREIETALRDFEPRLVAGIESAVCERVRVRKHAIGLVAVAHVLLNAEVVHAEVKVQSGGHANRAEIGRAVVNFDGPLVFCVISRFQGGAFVVFSRALNENL